MAHFAEIDGNGTVLRVVVISNSDLRDADGNESEAIGVAFCLSFFGSGTWVQTSYNSNFRKNYAGIGSTYDATRDAFLPPKLYASWVLDESTCQWQAPVPCPEDGASYTWDEDSLNWTAE